MSCAEEFTRRIEADAHWTQGRKISYRHPEESRFRTEHYMATEADAKTIFSALNIPGAHVTFHDGQYVRLHLYGQRRWELQFQDQTTVYLATLKPEDCQRLAEAIYREEDPRSAPNLKHLTWMHLPAEPMGFTTYQPAECWIDESGTLCVNAGGISKTGQIWDGYCEFKTSDSEYRFWEWLTTVEEWAFPGSSLTHDLIAKLKQEFANQSGSDLPNSGN